jgi:hypothetical protein
MATAATIKKNIAKLEAALKSKATPKTLKPKLEAQLVKSKAELSGINKGTKPKTSSTKSTQTALQKLKEMVNKNKKFKTYKGAGVDLEKDADRPALKTGKRTAKKSGNTYYEYRANRIDVKQPSKTARYPKLEKGGYMADGGEVDRERMYNFLKDDLAALEKAIEANNQEEINDIFLYWNRHLKDLEPKTGSKRMYEFLKDDLVGLEAATKELPSSKEETDRFFSYWNIHLKSLEPENGKMAKGGVSEKPIPAIMDKYGNVKSEKKLEQDLEYLKEAYEDKLVTKDEYEKSYNEIKEQIKFLQSKEKGGYFAKGGYVAVSEKDGYWYIMSKPTTKEKAQEMINLGVPSGEVGKVVTLDEAKSHKKVIGEEYLEKGGYMAKGGALEHGLMVGDTVRDIAENSVAIYNVNNRKSYVVDLDKGTRTEWIGSFKDRRKYAEKGAYMEMGGEMHRTQE